MRERKLRKPSLRNAVFCAVTIVVLVGLMSAAIVARSKLTIVAQKRSYAELSSVMSDTHQLVISRYKQGQSTTSLLANSAVVIAATKALFEDEGYQDRNFSTKDVLAAYLNPLVEEQGFLGYALVTKDGAFLAASSGQAKAQTQRFTDQREVFESAWWNSTSISHPRFLNPTDLIDDKGISHSDVQSVLVAPVRNNNGESLALLVVLFDLEKEFESLIRLGQFRDTGETIFFDAQGRLLSRPRFDISIHDTIGHEAHQHALLQFPDFEKETAKASEEGQVAGSVHSAKITAKEFVSRLRENQNNQNVADMRSYASYHGQRVLGVWYWDEDLGIGLSTEIFESESIGNSVGVTLIVGLLAVIMLYVLTILFLILRGGDAKTDKENSISEIVDTVADIVLTVSSNGDVLSFNRCATDLLGLIPDAIESVHLASLVSSDGVIDGMSQELRHTLESKETIDLKLLQGERVRCRAYHIDGTSFAAEITVNEAASKSGEQFTCVICDITERLASEEEIRRLVYTDPLTGLANRNEFYRKLESAIKEARRFETLVSVMLLDLDQFKQINDAFGHDVGDGILKAVGKRLQACGREVDTIAHLSGDEFVFIATGLNLYEDATRPAERILKALEEPIEIDGYAHHIGTSIGISFFPQDDSSRSELLRKADIALYQAKQRGRGNIQFFDTKLDEDVRARKILEGDLRAAIKNQDLALHYQPQLDFEGNVVGAEALLRWQREDGSFVSPEIFVGLAESCGLIGEIGDWVMNEACRQAKSWEAEGYSDIRMAVNVSPIQFDDEDLVSKVAEAIRSANLAPEKLELEITESVVMVDFDQAIEKLIALRDKGINLAIDDFGTGHSSLAYLKKMPVDRLKIDRSFLEGLPGSGGDESIVEAVITLGKSMSLEVVAEGVETMAQYVQLEKMGCDFVQGFYFSKPLSAEDFKVWYETRKVSPAIDLQSQVKSGQDSA